MNERKKLIVMIGIPASGKSSWAREYAERNPNTKVVSRDTIRCNLTKGSDDYFSKEQEVYQTFIYEIKEGLARYDTTIADATHINKHSRKKLLRALNSALKNVDVIAQVIIIPEEIAIERNETRIGTWFYVPKSVIRRMYNQLEIPTLSEGFTYIGEINDE